MKVSRGACALALAAALLAAGCGSGKKKPAAPKTKAQYAALVVPICQDLHVKLETLSVHLTDLETAIREAVHLAEATNAKLRTIPAPPGDPVPGEWLHWRELMTSYVKQEVEAAPYSKTRKAASAAENNAKNKARSIARNYGLGVCAQL